METIDELNDVRDACASLTCPVCGATLPSHAKHCVVCGLSLKESDSFEQGGADSAGKDATHSSGRSVGRRVSRSVDRVASHSDGASGLRKIPKKVLIGASAGVLVIVIGFVGFKIYEAYTYDQHLKELAESSQISADANTGLVENTTATFDDAGTTSGLVAGGGVVASADSSVYLASARGVLSTDALGEQSDFARVTDDTAICLNYYGQDLYYLDFDKRSVSSSIDDVLSGTEVRKCAGLGDSTDSSAQGIRGSSFSQLVYSAQGSARLSCLSVYDGRAYVLETDGDDFKVISLACDTSDTSELYAGKAQRVWLGIEDDTLYVIYTFDDSWQVLRLDLSRTNASFVTQMTGEGKLASACMYDKALFYSLDESGAPSRLYCRHSGGDFTEYSDVTSCVRITCAGDIIVALSDKGEVFWVHANTGFTHDITADMQSLCGHIDAVQTAIGVSGAWIYVSDFSSGAALYNVNNEKFVKIPAD